MQLCPVADSPDSIDVNRQHDGGERRDNQTLLDDEFEIAITIDVISQQRRGQQRTEVRERLQIKSRDSSAPQANAKRRQNENRDNDERNSERSQYAPLARGRCAARDQQFGSCTDAERINHPHRKRQHEGRKFGNHRRVGARPNSRNCQDEKQAG